MPNIVVAVGLAIGFAFGVVGQLSGFCLLSSLRAQWTKSDGTRLRSFAIALGVAILGTQLLAQSGAVDIATSLYLQPTFSAPVILVGGILFGLGMVLANGCASRALVLLGKGNLRSLLVIVIIGIAAQMTLKGLFAPVRLALIQWTQIPVTVVSLPGLVEAIGIAPSLARISMAILIGFALFAFAMSDASFRRAYGQVTAGITVGALVVAGWAATGWVGADDFSPTPVTSITFVSPAADALQYVMFSTGMTANFSIALVAGVLIGSSLAAVSKGTFAVEGFNSPQHMLRSIAGAVLMGIGGAMAYGCSIGQGLTGLSTLAIPSMIAVFGIVLGAAVGLRGPALRSALSSR